MLTTRTTMPAIRTNTLSALVALTVLGLAALPQTARAQTFSLGNGDSATVSGTGTVGVVGGQPVSNGTSSYSSTALPPTVYATGTANFTLAAGGSLSNSTSGDALATNGSGTFTVTGGTVSSGANGIAADFNGSSQVSVTGGVFTAGSNGFALEAEGTSLVKIAGGTFTAGKYGLVTYTSGIIDLFGTGFSYTVNGVTTPITSGTLPSGGASGTISGILLNGQALNNTPFYNRATMQVNVGTPPAAAPEPSSVAALGLGVLGLCGLALRARKRLIWGGVAN